MFGDFISRLEYKLNLPLPGKESQYRMAPSSRLNLLNLKNPFKPRQSAVLILLFPVDGSPCTVFIERASYNGKHSGEIGLPGGKAEKFDNDLVDTALREAAEEIGIRREDTRVIGNLTQLFVPVSNFCIQPVVGVMQYKPEFIPDPAEVNDTIVISIDDLLDPANKQVEELKIVAFKITAPYYNAHSHHIWGATAMILSEFLEVAGK